MALRCAHKPLHFVPALAGIDTSSSVSHSSFVRQHSMTHESPNFWCKAHMQSNLVRRTEHAHCSPIQMLQRCAVTQQDKSDVLGLQQMSSETPQVPAVLNGLVRLSWRSVTIEPGWRL